MWCYHHCRLNRVWQDHRAALDDFKKKRFLALTRSRNLYRTTHKKLLSICVSKKLILQRRYFNVSPINN